MEIADGDNHCMQGAQRRSRKETISAAGTGQGEFTFWIPFVCCELFVCHGSIWIPWIPCCQEQSVKEGWRQHQTQGCFHFFCWLWRCWILFSGLDSLTCCTYTSVQRTILKKTEFCSLFFLFCTFYLGPNLPSGIQVDSLTIAGSQACPEKRRATIYSTMCRALSFARERRWLPLGSDTHLCSYIGYIASWTADPYIFSLHMT